MSSDFMETLTVNDDLDFKKLVRWEIEMSRVEMSCLKFIMVDQFWFSFSSPAGVQFMHRYVLSVMRKINPKKVMCLM